MDKIAILIPCYNECITIEKVITDFKKELPEATIYVYDNNSTDGTDIIAKKAGAIVRYENKQGKGNVVRSMFNEIDAECYLIVDGDDTYPSENAKELCNAILEKKMDMAIGDRLSSTCFKNNTRLFHNFGNKLIRKIINRIYKSNINDVMTGYRAFNKNFVKSFPALSNGFEVETEMTIYLLKNNMKYENIIIQYRDRPNGSKSKIKTFSDGLKIIKFIFKNK